MGQYNLDQLLVDAELLLEGHITIHDLTGVFRSKAGRYLLGENRYRHMHPCCRLIHDARCLRDCQVKANAKATRQGRYFIQRCWKDVVEVVVPLIENQTHVATLFFGTFCIAEEEKPVAGRPRKQAFGKAYKALQVLASDRAQRLGRTLTALGQTLLAKAYENREGVVGSGGRKGQIESFMQQRFQSSVSLMNLAEVLNLSVSRTGHVVKELFGLSFQMLLMQTRLDRAKNLMLGTSLPVYQVAERCGLPDVYHFNRMFKKQYGLPPGRYRKKHRVHVDA